MSVRRLLVCCVWLIREVQDLQLDLSAHTRLSPTHEGPSLRSLAVSSQPGREGGCADKQIDSGLIHQIQRRHHTCIPATFGSVV
mmetsp:Transcript_18787/g.53892  ORF Transcript_18787/g.53892 Transcript_18787/m.53892 type:complete len:84 (+) Transcript_18787:2267-2518(+)